MFMEVVVGECPLQAKRLTTTILPKILPQVLEKMFPSSNGRDKTRILSVEPLKDGEEGMNSLTNDCKNRAAEESTFSKSFQAGFGRCEHKTSWADMVEEDELEFGSGKNDYPLNSLGDPAHKSSFSDKFSAALMNEEGFKDENVNPNIILGSIDLGGGSLIQPDKRRLSSAAEESTFSAASRNVDSNIIPETPKLHGREVMLSLIDDLGDIYWFNMLTSSIVC
ncbi:hypothetical protein C2S51_037316 [Perilla frutescens var. frutescens]|nr:hypothetical protein C2S51_037316 [Perilla frutescens var. frutescens]